jgi:hypothetical protein
MTTTTAYRDMTPVQRAALAEKDPKQFAAARTAHFAAVRTLSTARNAARNIEQRRELTKQLAELTRTTGDGPEAA